MSDAENKQLSPETMRAAFSEVHGYWTDELEALLHADPRYLAAYDRLLRVTVDRASLSRKQQELICIAVNAQVTHLNSAATALHVGAARSFGASDAEVIETIQLAASLGTHSMLIGVPILHDVLEELAGAADVGDEHLDDFRTGLKERFQRDRKYWSPLWDTILAYAPEYFETYLDLSSIPWIHGVLDNWFRELIYVAIDVSTTHLFESGIRVHSKKALEYGATPEQLVDVMTITSAIGIQTTLLGAYHVHRTAAPAVSGAKSASPTTIESDSTKEEL